MQAGTFDASLARRLAEVFAALSDPTRLRIIYALLQNEMCVRDLASLVGVSESGVSHQLAGLRRLRLVKNRREGQHIFYALSDDHVVNLLSQCLEHVGEVG